MASPIFLFIDRQNRVLASAFGGVSAFPSFFAYDQQQFRVQIGDPPLSQFPPNNVYTPADFTGLTLDVDLGPQPLGAGGGATSSVHGTAWDAANKWFLPAPLDLSQAATILLLAGKSSVQVFLEFTILQAGLPQLRFQFQPTLLSVLDTGIAAAAPPAGPQYVYVQDLRGGYLSKGPTTSDTKLWLSQDLTKCKIQYLDNNGEMRFDPIPVPPLPLY